MTQVFVRRKGRETGSSAIVFEPGKNLQTGEAKFKKIFGEITSLESDLLLVAATVFAADRCIKRGEREEFSRAIELSIPVINAGSLQPFRADLEDVLRTLSNDAWRITFRQTAGKPEDKPALSNSEGKTLLFSGGLDSLAAAIELGKAGKLLLVSHTTRGHKTSGIQDDLVAMMKTIGISLPHYKFQVTASRKSPSPNLSFDVESSQRTRSFMFLILAVLCARRSGHKDVVVVAENGQMAVHLPLTQGRIGAFSTHTAHPEVLRKMQNALGGVLDFPLTIINPFVHKTKAEVVDTVWKALPSAVPISIS